MASFRRFFLTLMICATFVALSGCGNDNSSFTIIPGGPTIVFKGGSLQFDTNPAGLNVTWSVDGGASNGSIDQDGLYTAPGTLPVDPQITVMAENDGQTATALVDLRTGNFISFMGPETINDTPIPFITSLIELLGAGTSSRIAAKTGSLEVSSTWAFRGAAASDAMFNQSFDLASFGSERNLTNDGTNNQLVSSLFIDDSLNPALLLADASSGTTQIKFLGSTNQGANFNAPIPIETNSNFQNHGNMQMDLNGTIHLVFNEGATGPLTDAQIKYTQSRDGGATWDPAIFVNPSANPQCFPNLAVSDDGNIVQVCYLEDCSAPGPNVFSATSVDGGQNFANTDQLSVSSMSGPCNSGVLNDEILVSYQDGENVVLARSSDQGDTFPEKTTVNTMATHADGLLPFMAIDSLGRIDIIFTADPNNTGDEDSLRYARSTDGGDSFSADVEIASIVAGNLIFATGITHDQSGRVHIQYVSDEDDPGVTYDLLYLLGE